MFFPNLNIGDALEFIRYIGTHMGIGQWNMFQWAIGFLYLSLFGDLLRRVIMAWMRLKMHMSSSEEK